MKALTTDRKKLVGGFRTEAAHEPNIHDDELPFTGG
jgi:hypothetical protein